MDFSYSRIVHFQDTDGAGVVYFTNLLNFCHEAYEVSLSSSGINLREFFTHPKLAIPITHASINFYRPLFCGDQIIIQFNSHLLNENEFKIDYKIFAEGNLDTPLATAITHHVCIDPLTRKRHPLSPQLRQWISLNFDKNYGKI